MGLLAFATERRAGDGADGSFFVDGTRGVKVPASLEAAAAEALVSDACTAPATCAELGRRALPGGGYLVSVRQPHAVTVESRRPAPRGRAVRCGADFSDLTMPDPEARAWRTDPSNVVRARGLGETLCGSVRALP